MLSLIFLFSSLMVSTQTEWTWSVHPESNFKVLTPFRLEHKTTEFPTENQPITYHQYHGGSFNDSLHLILVIDHYTVTENEIGGDEEYLQEFFGVTVDQILKSIGGTLTYMDFTSSADRDVCIWRASYREGSGVIRGKLVISGDKYYGLQAFGLTQDKPDGLMHKFFESFQMIKP